MSKAHSPAKPSQAKPAKRRNTLLTIALIIVILHGIVLAAVYWTVLPDTQRTLGNVAVWSMFLASAADIVAAVAMWFWKRWGIYLYGIAAVVGAIVAVLASGDLFLMFGALLPPIIVLYIVMMQRDKFE
jgi:hypothetical protein